MTDAQTEARAIAQASLWGPANPEHAKLGWTYDFEQTERIARAAYDSTGYDATMEVVEFVMAEADRRHRDALTTERAAHAETKRELLEMEKSQMRQAAACGMATSRAEAATALAANDAELDGAVFLKDAAEAALRKREVEINKLHAQLAEARKALEPFADIAGEPWADESGWTDAACQNDRICDWFGPSAFLAARRAQTGGKKDG